MSTPKTDAEFDRLRFIVEPNEIGMESQRDVVVFGMRDFARNLEAERDQLKACCDLFIATLSGFEEDDLFEDQIAAKNAYNQLPHVKNSPVE